MNLFAALVQLGHREFREDAAAIELPLLLLLQQQRTHQADDRSVVGEDADDAGAALDLLVQPFQRVGAQILRQCSGGKLRNASTSSLACSIRAAAAGNFSVSIVIT